MLKANLLVESWPNGPGVCCISNAHFVSLGVMYVVVCDVCALKW